MDFEIEYNASKLYKSELDTISSEIYFRFTDDYFPEKGWNDFVVTILIWWIEAFIKLFLNEEDTVEFDFMDGPFTIEAEDKQKNLDCKCLEGINSKVVAKFSVDKDLFGKNLKKVANQVIRDCISKGYQTNELHKLNAKLSKLQKL